VTELEQTPTSRFIGAIFITVGVLMALLCGACTFRVLYYTYFPEPLSDATRGEWMMASAPIMFTIVGLIVGGTPTMLGLMLVWSGIKRVRRSASAGPHPGPSA
jgi:ABC-type transport system involved in cytochrome c biogenesis permease subunit